jgi:hypothetical protein
LLSEVTHACVIRGFYLVDQEGEEVPGTGRHLTLEEEFSSLALKIKEDEGELLEAGLLHLIV